MLPVVFEKDEAFNITKNNQLAVLPYLGRSYEITFQLYLNTVPSSDAGFSSILHLTTGGDCCDYGQRTPALFTYSNNKFQFASAIDGNGNYYKTIDYQLTSQKWYNFEISQLLNSNLEVRNIF